MVVSFGTFILAVIVTQVISFVVSGLLYMNPLVSRFYKANENHPAMKKGNSQGKWMLKMFIFTLFEVFFAGLIFFITANALPGIGWWKGLYFGLLLAGVRVYSRFVMMFMMTCYPNSLNAIEFINGVIDCVIIGLCFSYFLH